jgi:hypothetical protein
LLPGGGGVLRSGALPGVLAKVASDGACSALITGGLVPLNFITEVPLYAWEHQ